MDILPCIVVLARFIYAHVPRRIQYNRHEENAIQKRAAKLPPFVAFAGDLIVEETTRVVITFVFAFAFVFAVAVIVVAFVVAIVVIVFVF